MRVISLGAGVQSTTMALMAAEGLIGPMPDCAIFADTGWEPKSVYNHLHKLINFLPFPVHIVSSGNLRNDLINGSNSTGGRFAAVPWFTSNGGMGLRQCTNEYKLVPIRKKLRDLLGYKKGQRIPHKSIEVWIGISTDEIQRMKDSRDKWQIHRWPLIEERMSRQQCLSYLNKKGWFAPKSACIGCPYHSDSMWREMRDHDPESWSDALYVDKAIRRGGGGKMKYDQFMHRSLKPLDQVDLSTAKEKGQVEFGFIQECDAMCGL